MEISARLLIAKRYLRGEETTEEALSCIDDLLFDYLPEYNGSRINWIPLIRKAIEKAESGE